MGVAGVGGDGLTDERGQFGHGWYYSVFRDDPALIPNAVEELLRESIKAASGYLAMRVRTSKSMV